MNEEVARPTSSSARGSSRRSARILDEWGFVEVETPILQPRYGGAFAEPFVTHYNALDEDLYLRIATELYLKRLIVGGLEKVYEIGKDFRNEGVSFKHNPEFTMLEWYEAYADYERHDGAHRAARRATSRSRGARHDEGDVQGATRSTSRRRGSACKFVDALEEHGPLDARRGRAASSRLEERDVDVSHDPTWSKLIDHALTAFVEPSLIQPTILYDYPIELSPFARTTDDDPTIVERFEYFVGGMELGNAFTEINDAEEQAAALRDAGRRSAQAATSRPRRAIPTTSRRSPTACRRPAGIGLGIDRLAMVFTGRDSIRDVILFPALRTRE